MYRIYADNTLIYDSTMEDYKIGKGLITKEADKSGSFVFSVYPDHPFYNSFVQMKTVITVYKSGRIVFRGRILDDATDYWNAKTITCEGELGFLQDSVARPFSFQGDHADLFAQFIAEHNSQVDEWKKFKVGTVTVVDENAYINRSAGGYGAMLDTMHSALTESALGGHFYITHGGDGTDPIPTLHYVADFPKTASQGIEFGVNLKDYTKKVSAVDLATCIIPLGTSNGSDGERLTIEQANGGKDYIYDANAVAMYGWIVKVVTWDDVTLANHLLTKGRAWLQAVVNQHATIELSAIDMHLLDRSIESYNVCEYVRATSKPHGLDALMLCSKQTMDLLKPDNDTVTLGYSYGTLTGVNVKLGASVSTLGKSVSSIKQDAENIEMSVQDLNQNMGQFLRIGADGVTITNAAGSALRIDGGQIDAERLIVNAANITGKLTASQVEIDLTGSITWADLSSSVQNEINDAYAMAEDAEAAAADAADTVDGWRYNGGTYIDGSMVMAGTVIAGSLIGGEVGLLTSAEQLAGGLDITGASSSTYAIELYSNGALRLEAYNGAAYLGSDSASIEVSNYIWCNDHIFPSDPDSYNCGNANFPWAMVYSTNGMCETSDRNKKKDIVYGLDSMDGFFDSLLPSEYRMKNGTSGRKHFGFVAQDIKANLDKHGISTADFGGYVADVDKDGNEILGLRYSEFIPLIVDQVQKLKARVARMEGKK